MNITILTLLVILILIVSITAIIGVYSIRLSKQLARVDENLSIINKKLSIKASSSKL